MQKEGTRIHAHKNNGCQLLKILKSWMSYLLIRVIKRKEGKEFYPTLECFPSTLSRIYIRPRKCHQSILLLLRQILISQNGFPPYFDSSFNITLHKFTVPSLASCPPPPRPCIIIKIIAICKIVFSFHIKLMLNLNGSLPILFIQICYRLFSPSQFMSQNSFLPLLPYSHAIHKTPLVLLYHSQ